MAAISAWPCSLSRQCISSTSTIGCTSSAPYSTTFPTRVRNTKLYLQAHREDVEFAVLGPLGTSSPTLGSLLCNAGVAIGSTKALKLPMVVSCAPVVQLHRASAF